MKVVKHLTGLESNRNWKTPLNNYACSIRPVAAVMVTKIDGFQELMEDNQDLGSLLLSKSYRLQEYYFNHHGCTRMVKMGDTVLASFYSAEQAVKCAVKIQRGAQKMFDHKLSIGIHMGEVRYVDNDLFGTPVNIATDIHALSQPGQVLVSESVAQCLDSEKYSIGLQEYSLADTIPVYQIKSRIKAETSYIGYADSVDTRNIDHVHSWKTYNMVAGG